MILHIAESPQSAAEPRSNLPRGTGLGPLSRTRERVGVRGGAALRGRVEHLCDDGQNDLGASKDFVVWEPNHASAVARELRGPPAVVLHRRGLVVLTTIELDDQAGRTAVEIDDEWTDRVLTPELDTETRVPQVPPRYSLCVSGLAPELSSALLGSRSHEVFSEPHPRRCVPAGPHPNPLPPAGEGVEPLAGI